MQAQDSFTVGPADVQAATTSGRLSHISNGYDCLQVMPSGADTIPFRSLPSAPNAVSESHEAASTLAPTPALKRKAPAAEVQQAACSQEAAQRGQCRLRCVTLKRRSQACAWAQPQAAAEGEEPAPHAHNRVSMEVAVAHFFSCCHSTSGVVCQRGACPCGQPFWRALPLPLQYQSSAASVCAHLM